MAREIDDRVVRMSFDNKAFERGAAESMSSLEKLNDLIGRFGKGSFNGDISALSNAMNAVRDNTEALAERFTTLGGRIKEAFQASIVQDFVSAFEAPLQQLNQLTAQQVSAGWDKYAEKTTAVQSIMSATASDFEDVGEQMEYVNAQVDKLNWFTDETSFNLVDMTNNVGKFTSQGIALDDSATAMIGIAVAAGKAGATASDASRAMYNLSQSLGAGSVKLQDWMSIENANMATKEFKETLLEGAVAAGTLTKDEEGLYHYTVKTAKGIEDNIVTAANFREFLSEGIITSEALMNGLKEYGRFTEELKQLSDEADLSATEILEDMEAYADGTLNMTEAAERYSMSVQDLTDWMDELNSEQNALGRSAFKASQEAKTYQEAIDATADAISTSWMNIFQLIFGDYEKAKEVWTDFAGFLWDVFAQPVDTLYRAIKNYNDEIDGIGVNIRNVLYSIGEIGREVITPIGDAFSKVIRIQGIWDSAWEDTEDLIGGGLQRITKKVSDAATGFSAFMQTLGEYRSDDEILSSRATDLIMYVQAYREYGDAALEDLGLTDELAKRVKNLSNFFGDLIPEFALVKLDRASDIMDGLTNIFTGLFSAVRLAGTVVGRFLSETWDALAPTVGSFRDFLYSAIIKAGEFGTSIEKLFRKVKGSTDPMFFGWTTFISSMSEKLSGMYWKLKPVTELLVNGFQKGISWLVNTGIPAVRSAFGSLFDKLSYFFDSGWDPLYSIKEMLGFAKDASTEGFFESIKNGLGNLQNPFNFENMKPLSEVFSGNNIASFISELRTSISESERFQAIWEKITSFNFKEFFGSIVDWFKEIDFKGMAQKAGEFIDSLDIPENTRDAIKNAKDEIVGFAKRIKELAGDLTATEWVTILKKLPKLFSSIGVALASIKAGGGIANFGKGMKDIGSGASTLSKKVPAWKQVTNFFKGFRKDIKSLTKQVTGNTFPASLKKIAQSLLMVAAALLIVSMIDTATLITNGAMLATVFTVMALALKTFAENTPEQSKAIETAATSLIKLGAALLLVAVALRMLARVKPEALVASFAALAAMLLLMTYSIKQLDDTDPKKAATGMLIMALAIDVLAVAVVALGMVPLLFLAKGLGAVAIMMATMSKSLQKLNGADSMKAAAGMIMIALAIDLLVPGLTILGALPLIVLAKGLVAIGILLAEMGTVLALLDGEESIKVAAAIDMIAASFIILVPALTKLGTMDIWTLIQGLAGIAAVFVILGVAAVVLGPLSETILLLSISMAALGIGVLAACVGIYQFAAAVALFVTLGPAAVAAIQAVIIGIISLLPTIAIAIVDGIVSFAAAIVENIGVLAEAVITCIEGIALAIAEGAPIIIESALVVVEALLKSLADHLPQIMQYGWEIIKTLVGGIGKAIWSLIPDSGKEAIRGFVQSLKDKIVDIYNVGRNIVEGLVNGVKSHIAGLFNFFGELANNVVGVVKRILRISSPSKEFAWVGEMVDAGFANGLEDNAKDVTDAAAAVGEGAILSVKDIASKMGDVLNDDLSPVITPVLDLTDVENGATDLQNMLSADRSVSIAGRVRPTLNSADAEAVTMVGLSGLVTKLEEAIAGIQNGEQNNSFDFYLDGAKLEAVVTKRQRQRAIATGR